MGAVILEGVNGFSVHYTLRKVPETSSDKRLCALFICSFKTSMRIVLTSTLTISLIYLFILFFSL